LGAKRDYDQLTHRIARDEAREAAGRALMPPGQSDTGAALARARREREREHERDPVDLVLVAPGRDLVLVRTEFPRTIKLEPADARELARQLERCAEFLEAKP
jgi:hypothetical protein